MDKCDGIRLTLPLSPVKTMTAPCKQMQANEKATWSALFMSASAASADTRLRRADSPFSPSTYCTRTGLWLLGACPECPSRFASARFRDEPS